MKEVLEELEIRQASARARAAGKKRIEAQHAKGKLSARERLAVLLDEGSFEEHDIFVEHRCTEFGMEEINSARRWRRHRVGHDQRPARLRFLQDFTVFGGSLPKPTPRRS